MTLNLIAFLVFGGSVLYWFKWCKLGIVLICLSAIVYGSIASALLPDYLMYRLQASYSSQMDAPIEDNTAFVVFGMGTQAVEEAGKTAVEPLAFSYGPILAAVRRQHQCIQNNLKCTFITTGADVAGTGVSEAASIATELEKAGISSAAIIKEDQSRNTWQNAKNTALILQNLKPRKVVLLQAAPMMSRSLLYLAHFGIVAEPVAAAYLGMKHTNLSSTGLYFLATDLALHEQVGIWRYAFYNFMHWNEPKLPPSQGS